MVQRLNIFISSTSDLKKWRKASAKALAELNIDDLRFESWPSSPNDPIKECLLNIEASDGLILILGKNYGTIVQDGISATHIEFRHAIKHKKPIFVYLLKKQKYDLKQIAFKEEVERSEFRCQSIISVQDFQVGIRNSFLQEFVRCFRKVHFPPDDINYKKLDEIKQDNIFPTHNHKDVYNLLLKLFNEGNDVEIHNYWNDCIGRFSKFPEIMNIMYSAEVNLGMSGYMIDESHLKGAISFWSNNAVKHNGINYNIGNAYLSLKDFDNSIKYYKLSLTHNVNDAECWHNLGSSYKGNNDFELALNSYQRSLEINPKLFQTLLSISLYYYRIKNDPDKALFYLNKISLAELSSKHKSYVLGWKASFNIDLSDYEAGIANAEDAINYNKDEDWPWFIAGRLYALIRVQDSNWVKLSEQFWKKFIERYSNNSQAWVELGFIYWILKNNEPNEKLNQICLSSFERAIELGYDDNGLVYDRIGHLYQDDKRYFEAEKAFREATYKNQNDFGYCLGVCLILLNKYEEALPYVIDAAEKYQPDYLSWFQVGYCYEKLGHFSMAENALKKAINLNGEYSEAYFNLGGLYWNNGQIEEARSIWKIAITKFPNHELCVKAKEFLGSAG